MSIESHAVFRTVEVWAGATPEFREHIRYTWPDLYQALNALMQGQDHIITERGAPPVPRVAPAVPRSAPQRHSAAPMGRRGDRTTSDRPTPVQDALPIKIEEE